jgi:hypothetical protein
MQFAQTSDFQEQKQVLLQVATRLAAWHIERGGFIPFGAVLGPGRYIKLIRPKSWKQNPTRDEADAYWGRVLRRGSNETGGRTVCSCSEVRAHWEGGELIPGVLIHIEQAEILSEDIFYPFEKTESCQVVFGPPTAAKTAPQVFGTSEFIH